MVTMCQIPLKKLYIRRSENREPDMKGTGIVTKLADSIMEYGGLMAPLTVQLPHPGSKGEWYRVIDGGMRLAALKLLLLQKKIKPNYSVPCAVRDRLSDVEIREFRDSMSGTSAADAEARRLESERSKVEELAEKANLFPWQAQMVAEMIARGRLDGVWGKNVGKTAALNYAIQAQAVEVGNLYRAYKERQSEDRASRVRQPVHVVDIDISKLTDETVLNAIREKKRLFEADFAGFEVRLAEYAQRDVEYTQALWGKWIQHGYGMTPEYYYMDAPPARIFDLGDDW